MYSKLEEFKKDWKYESESTLKVLNQLSDDSLNKKFSDNIRTPGKIAWHIVATLGEMVQRTGLKFDSAPEDVPIPSAVKEILTGYKRSSDEMIKAITTEWNDDSLNEDIELYGQTWKKGIVLSSLINHQIHHRGQLTVLMRMAGLKVPGVYGPAKEEWAQMGMPPQD
ncbi:MAG: DinB family protein [Ignavibacteria bacterium]|nr:DinB family protein [Ignavibacteria bacterium]